MCNGLLRALFHFKEYFKCNSPDDHSLNEVAKQKEEIEKFFLEAKILKSKQDEHRRKEEQARKLQQDMELAAQRKEESRKRKEAEVTKKHRDSQIRLQRKKDTAEKIKEQKESDRIAEIERVRQYQLDRERFRVEQGLPRVGEAFFSILDTEKWAAVIPDIDLVGGVVSVEDNSNRTTESARQSAVRRSRELAAANERHRQEKGLKKPGSAFFDMFAADSLTAIQDVEADGSQWTESNVDGGCPRSDVLVVREDELHPSTAEQQDVCASSARRDTT